MFSALTHQIKVEVEPAYVRDQSNPMQSHYFFTYKVRISNQRPSPVTLLSRHWVITDGFGSVEEVEGPGVVGVQPTIKPGDFFEYSSFCPLPTPTGFMQGTYEMLDEKGEALEIEIPRFTLSEPSHFH